jgi:hypothetical protein
MIRKTTILASTKTAAVVLLGGLLLALLSTPAQADVLNLGSGNSAVQIDTGSSGVSQWQVDGTNFLQQQQWWYRVGATGPEKTINQAGLLNAGTSDGDFDGQDETASIRYGTPSGVTYLLKYTLTGGDAGDGTSHLDETMTVKNNGTSSVTLHLYEYTHMQNLSSGAPSDTVSFDGSSSVEQIGLSETAAEVVTTKPARHEAALFNQTATELNDGLPTNLDNSNVAGPGDSTWAFQWDFTLAPGKTYFISKGKTLSVSEPVPEPSTFALLLIGALALVAFACRGKVAA